MFRQQKLSILDDYFKELSVRTTREEVYFYRISGYTPQVAAFIRKYYEEARLRGVVIEGRIPNPAGQNLSYYEEMMGMDFQMAPGFIETAMTAVLPEAARNAMLDQIPLKRPGQDLDIAYAVAFLASDEAGYVTGQVINVNGGMYM